ncbi:MAG TPA: hypothetical protein VM925_23915 [Labilithrix sp.]|nr:hypothetical protein [Labilithrix sp.]
MSWTASRVAALLLAGLVAACSGGASGGEDVAESEDELRTTYGDLLTTLEAQDLDRWVAVRSALKAGFDRICGDTICGGDYSNLTTVRLACSSTTKARKLKDCTWVLGGSIEYVAGATGKLSSEARVFTCKIPVAGSAKSMLETLHGAGDDALHTALPATGKSFYDGLVDCFAGVVGPPPPEASSEESYTDLETFSWNAGEAQGLAWFETTRRLAKGFDDACGDSFCEGEYPDIAPLRFACSVKIDTKRVSRCSWTFAAAELSVDSRGRVVANTTTKRCAVDISAQATALATALQGPDPLHALLPGKKTSIYDALIGCL